MRAHKSYKSKKYGRVSKYVARASGSILGYTIGNIPGAVAGYKLGSALTRNKRSVNYDGVTTQKDDRLAYKKRSMPYKKKKAWKKFSKRVAAVSLQNRGLNVLKVNSDIPAAITNTAYGQVAKAFHLYSCNGTAGVIYADQGLNDLLYLTGDPNLRAHSWIKQVGGVPNPTLPSDTGGYQKIRMQSAVLDVYIRNSGTVPLVVQIYHVWYKKQSSKCSSFTNASAQFTYQDIPLQSATTTSVANLNSLVLGNRSVTPFDMPELIGYMGITIKSMREVYLPAGNLHTVQIRDPKNHLIDLNQVVNFNGGNYANDKLTESIIVVSKNLNSTDGSITMYSDRTYRYTCEGITEDHTGLIITNA